MNDTYRITLNGGPADGETLELIGVVPRRLWHNGAAYTITDIVGSLQGHWLPDATPTLADFTAPTNRRLVSDRAGGFTHGPSVPAPTPASPAEAFAGLIAGATGGVAVVMGGILAHGIVFAHRWLADLLGGSTNLALIALGVGALTGTIAVIRNPQHFRR